MLNDADRALITDVQVSSGARISPQQGIIQTRVVSYRVGKLGPFSLIIDFVHFSKVAVDEAWAAEIATLRGIGAL